jgi:lipopolysaccharide/colanic/teichoic acid biosynthesis glycosyltransferase
VSPPWDRESKENGRMPMVRSRYLDAGPMVAVRRRPTRSGTVALGWKYSIDRVAALCGLLVTAPLLAAIALMLRVTGERPVLRRSELLAERGRIITLLAFAATRESRLGRVLERTGLAALPQLWNVLRGELSLVGPRPRTIDFPAPLARPGLTGLAQLEQLRRPLSPAERLELDDEYARSWSLARDAWIVVRTMWRVASSAL